MNTVAKEQNPYTERMLDMIEEFQCPGCVCGSSPREDCFRPAPLMDGWPRFNCNAHVAGTMVLGIGSFYLGLPKGFCRVGMRSEAAYRRVQEKEGAHTNIRLWLKGTNPGWDDFNVAVWAMEKDGYLFVRTYSPRTNNSNVDVIEGGTLDLCPNAIDVGKFYEEID